jgi:tRNA A37 threonylcarbamoyladenosine synthetase subunit TsaC/SUA5/YrdC
VPHNPIAHAILEAMGSPLIATSVRIENEDMETEYLTNPELIFEEFRDKVDLVVDGGIGEDEPSTVINCSNSALEVIRYGKGEIDI